LAALQHVILRFMFSFTSLTPSFSLSLFFFPSWLYFVGVSLFAVYISLLLVFGGAVLNGIDETITEAMNTRRFSHSLW
jgi:lipoprotein signal peptidase